MAQSIYCGICHGGPLNGQEFVQITKAPTVSGCFNYESSITGAKGSYSFTFGTGWIWSASDALSTRQGEKGSGT